MRYADGGGLSAEGRARRESVRLLAAWLFEQDVTARQIARSLRVSTKSVYQWRRAWRAGGEAALASKGPGGSGCKLDGGSAGAAEFPAIWGPMLDQVWSFLRGGAPEGLYKQGHNIMLYKDDVPHVEVGVQVSGSFGPAGHVVASTLPGGLVATATHTGPIAKIGDTHQAVREWSKANGHRLAGPRWEIYGDPDPSSGDFTVQVFWSLVAP